MVASSADGSPNFASRSTSSRSPAAISFCTPSWSGSLARIALSEPFEDGLALSAWPRNAGLEGVVSKRPRLLGAKSIGTDGVYSSAVVRSVADGNLEWEVKNYLALFVSDDKRATVRCMSV